MREDPLTPTDEQSAILTAAKAKGNLIINALAGTGKTSTLELLERAVREKPILYLCFNFRVAAEARERMLSTTTVKTLNGIGQSVWAKGRTIRLMKGGLKDNKTNLIFAEIANAAPKAQRDIIWETYPAVKAGVDLAKALGYAPEGAPNTARPLTDVQTLHKALDEVPDDLTADLIDEVLRRSITLAYRGTIDYNDQIYMPALFGGSFPKFPLVMVDEAQDLSPANHALLRRLVSPTSRLVAVGDPWQNIYGFRGAKQGGMAEIQQTYSMTPMDLSISFRCPQAVVEAARWRVPHFKWRKAGGHVNTLDQLEVNNIPEHATFLCRNNAPLFKLGLQLLSHGRSVTIQGSDIGPRLVAIMRKLGDENLSRSDSLGAIDDWLDDKLSRESTTAQDLAECMRVFVNMTESLGTAIKYVEHLFAQRGTLQLLTIHKAKGLEWDTVFHLDPWLCRETEQDMNLRYVATTRSADTLYHIDSHDIRWN